MLVSWCQLLSGAASWCQLRLGWNQHSATANDAPGNKHNNQCCTRRQVAITWSPEKFGYRNIHLQTVIRTTSNKFPVVYIQYRAKIPLEFMVNMQARACIFLELQQCRLCQANRCQMTVHWAPRLVRTHWGLIKNSDFKMKIYFVTLKGLVIPFRWIPHYSVSHHVTRGLPACNQHMSGRIDT